MAHINTRTPLQVTRWLINTPRYVWTAVLAIWVLCSWTYALLEQKGPIEGLWWGIVTGSTVGYGDFYPESTAGRFVGAVLICSMLLLIPIGIGHVIARLVVDRNEFTHEEQVEMQSMQREDVELARENNLLLRNLIELETGSVHLKNLLQSNGFPERRDHHPPLPIQETENA
jgi:hypothetical protein